MSVSRAKANEIFTMRKKGIYVNADTRNEANYCLSKMEKTDKVITLIHSLAGFSVYDMEEILPQLKTWKDMECRIRKCNMRTIQTESGEAYMFIVQPPKHKMEDTSHCPLALAFGTLVNGYTYITKDKSFAELCHRYLGSYE